MTDEFDAISTTAIEAPPERVWAVITDPAAAREFMFGTELSTDWAPGGPIRWRGEWHGEPYEDHGRAPPHPHVDPRGARWGHGADPQAGRQRDGRGDGALEADVGLARREGEGDRRARLSRTRGWSPAAGRVQPGGGHLDSGA